MCLDMSVGGHVESGETYEQAFRRETEEELSIDIDKVRYRFLGHLNPHNHDISAFMNVYEIEMDQTPNYNKEDFIEYFWLTPQALLDKLKGGDTSKDDLPKLIHKFYSSELR